MHVVLLVPTEEIDFSAVIEVSRTPRLFAFMFNLLPVTTPDYQLVDCRITLRTSYISTMRRFIRMEDKRVTLDKTFIHRQVSQDNRSIQGLQSARFWISNIAML